MEILVNLAKHKTSRNFLTWNTGRNITEQLISVGLSLIRFPREEEIENGIKILGWLNIFQNSWKTLIHRSKSQGTSSSVNKEKHTVTCLNKTLKIEDKENLGIQPECNQGHIKYKASDMNDHPSLVTCNGIHENIE